MVIKISVQLESADKLKREDVPFLKIRLGTRKVILIYFSNLKPMRTPDNMSDDLVMAKSW